MIFQDILPCLALQPFICTFRLVHLQFEPDAFPKTPYPTRIEQALVFFARGHIDCYDPISGMTRTIPRNALFGQQVSRLDFYQNVTADFLMLMVVFQPGGLYRLLGFSSNELTCEFCDAEPVMSTELQVVNDQIANASDYATMIDRAQEYFLRKLQKVKAGAHPVDKIGQLLLNNPGSCSLDWLADQACLSPRQFERKFSERVGVGPKLYSRINRFFHTLQYKEKHLHLDWLSIAVHFGYSDYDHLAKDFKQFAHVNPNLTFKEYTQRPEFIVQVRNL
ncbi:AraC family transcriptional regulator [Rhodocytophaga rosea]|uniref:AraC family transcriptional regulator n=1 Tax=Rhodocytophaga rosea TaxID=2704465 RepID=A0A6C0GIN3_9BACT|nr:helix-turn-helix domain-containing protein [Rhodocytophaga rosea]QHT67785.1 AraC family transcriptional regulator [Rhodocytophaga rosea]